MVKTLDIVTVGVAILAFGSSLAVFLFGFIGIWELVPMFLTIIGLWIVAMAAIKTVSETSPYERQPFSTAGLGLVLLAIGTSSWLVAQGLPPPYAVLTLTLIIGVLVIVAGVREWTKRKMG